MTNDNCLNFAVDEAVNTQADDSHSIGHYNFYKNQINLWLYLRQQAERSEGSGLLDEAEQFWLSAFETAKQFSNYDDQVCYTLKGIGNFYYRNGDFEKALTTFLLVAHLTHLTHGSEHILSADALNSLGVIYVAQESYPAAELCYDRALNVYSNMLGKQSSQAMAASQNLALVQAKQGKKESAMKSFLKSFQISQQVYGMQNRFSQIVVAQMANV